MSFVQFANISPLSFRRAKLFALSCLESLPGKVKEKGEQSHDLYDIYNRINNITGFAVHNNCRNCHCPGRKKALPKMAQQTVAKIFLEVASVIKSQRKARHHKGYLQKRRANS